MTPPIWITPAGNLGIIPELEYYDIPLDAYNASGSPLLFSLISGELPAGLVLYDTGRILGMPSLGQVRGVPFAVTKSTTSTFTIRIKNNLNQIADRTFSLTVAGILPPRLLPEESDLGTYIDGSFINIQLEVVEPNPLLVPTWELTDGALPPGISLSSTGLISGYATPIPAEEIYGPYGPIWQAFQSVYPNYGPSFDWENPDNTIFKIPFDTTGFDNEEIYVSRNYQFTITVNDTVNIDKQTYTLYIVSRKSLTADNSLITVDTTFVTTDTDQKFNPVLYTNEGILSSVYQSTNIAIQLVATDFDNDEIEFEIISGSLPPGLVLNSASGWITGTIPSLSLGASTYNFDVQVKKTLYPSYVSETKSFSIKVLGQIDNVISWNTAEYLGTIYTGSISDLTISASTVSNRALNYTLLTTGGLPPGLKLLESGEISGRVSFDNYTLDGGITTFDSTLTDFDHRYTFTISAADAENYVNGERTFILDVVSFDKKPYTNLYCQILPTREDRTKFYDILNNSDLIPNSFLYRQYDPWFGKNSDRLVLLQTGINSVNLSTYVNALQLNHYNKTFLFNDVKTARALDSNFNTLYEVVYLDLFDSVENSLGLGPNLAIEWPKNSANITTVYPNSLTNMATRITQGVGYQNKSILPRWMTSRQENGSILGFVHALVLAYTLPNKSKDIAYRIKDYLSDFNLINFTIDRYLLDNELSSNYQTSIVQGSGTITSSITSNVVSGTSTDFSHELYPGKTLFVSNILVGTISTVANANSLVLTSNALVNVDNSSYYFETNSFITNNFTIGSGNITSNVNSRYIQGLVTNITGTGLISANTTSTILIGTGTSFNTELEVGKQIYYSNASIGTISRILSNNTLYLTSPVSSNITNVSFTSDGTTTLFVSEILIGDTIVVNSNVRLGTVANIHSNTNIELTSNSLSTVSNVEFLHTTRNSYSIPNEGDKYLKFPKIGVLS